MCTAAAYKTGDFYFGRTLDYDFSYGETVTITPRNFELAFRNAGTVAHHYAFVGMAHITEGYPLYYDAVNEKGLCIAGLNFVGNAYYREKEEGKDNIAQWELIPWILGRCAAVDEAKELIAGTNLWAEPFGPHLPTAELHWMISDKGGSITVESVRDGLFVYDNPAGVLTNNPPFPIQMFNLNNYMGLSVDAPENCFSKKLRLDAYSRGMGAVGLPGDLSSMSRFVRVAFTKLNSLSEEDEKSSVSQFFHILGSVEQQRGCCRLAGGKYEISLYTSCCNADKGIYYYRTYDHHGIVGVDMRREDLDGDELILYQLIDDNILEIQN